MTIDKGLSFRVEATPHEGIGSKGLSVKVKVRKKQDAGTQYDTILKIKKVGSNDKTIHLVQSEQTMTSFNMLVENQNKSEKKKSSFFRNFKPGGCLDPPLDEDKQKYTPSAAVKSSTSSDSKNKCKYGKHDAPCVELNNEEKVHPIDKSSSASVLSLFKDVPASCLNASSSNIIITYPTHAKRSKVSTTSSKKSIDEKRKKSFSQTTELYFKPKSDETGAKSPTKVSKKNISREGHRSVDSDMLYIQDAAKAQIEYIRDDPIFNKKLNAPDVKSFHKEPQPVLVTDVKIREHAIIADDINNKKNEMPLGRGATLSDTILKQLNDITNTLDNDNTRADHIPIASAAGLTTAELTTAGLTAAVMKQPQYENTLNESVIVNVEGKKVDQLILNGSERLSLSTEEPLEEKQLINGAIKDNELLPEAPLGPTFKALTQDLNNKTANSKMLDDKTKIGAPMSDSKSKIPILDAQIIVKGKDSQNDIDNRSTQPQIMNDVKQPESTNNEIENVSSQLIMKDVNQPEGTEDHMETMKNVEKLTPLIQDIMSTSLLSEHDALTTTRPQEPGDRNKELEPTENIFSTRKVAHTDDKNKVLSLEPIAKQSLSKNASIKDIETELSTPRAEHLKRLDDHSGIEIKSKDKEDSNQYYRELRAGSEQDSIDSKNTEFIKDVSRNNIEETKLTETESPRQEHDSNKTLILDYPITEEETRRLRDVKTLTTAPKVSKNNIEETKLTENESPRREHDGNVTPILDYPITEEETGKVEDLTTLTAPNDEPIIKNVFNETISNLGPTSALPQSKNSSVIALAKDVTKQTKSVAGSQISSQSQITSSDIKITTKDSKVITSRHGSNKSLKLTREENKSSTQHIAANVFPLHKATSSHSMEYGDFPPKKISLTDPEKQEFSQNKNAMATDIENNVTSDANSAIISIAKIAKMESQLELPISKSSIPSLNQKTENNFKSLFDTTSSLLSTTAHQALSIFVEGSLAGSQTNASFDKEQNSELLSKFPQVPIYQELGSLDKFVREAESQLDNIVVKKSSDVIAKDSKQSVHNSLGSTLLQKPLTDKVGPTETPLDEPVHDQDLNSVTVVSSVTSIKDYLITSKDGSKVSIDKTAQTENMVLKSLETSVESAKDILRTEKRSLGGSITCSLAPSIDIHRTDQFLVDIAFKFSRNGAAKQTIIKSVDADSALSQLSGVNNIISHKSTTSKPFEHPIEIAINPKYNISLKLNHKQKRKTEKKHSISSFDIKSKLSNKVKKQGSIESNMRRKSMDLNIVLETIYKEQLQPLEINLKKLKAEILMLTKEQAYIQRSIYNLTEKRSCLRANRVKRSSSCMCKRNI